MKELKLMNESPLSKPAIILRELWVGLELVDKYADWSARWLDKFDQGVDYMEVRVNQNINGVKLTDHAVTIETAKHIVLMSDTANGKSYRVKLIALESAAQKPMTQLEMISAMALAQNEANQKIEQLQIDVKAIEAKQSAIGCDYGFYSVLGYANLVNRKLSTAEASALGKKATKASDIAGLQTGSVPDARYGKVKTYHESVLIEVFA